MHMRVIAQGVIPRRYAVADTRGPPAPTQLTGLERRGEQQYYANEFSLQYNTVGRSSAILRLRPSRNTCGR